MINNKFISINNFARVSHCFLKESGTMLRAHRAQYGERLWRSPAEALTQIKTWWFGNLNRHSLSDLLRLVLQTQPRSAVCRGRVKQPKLVEDAPHRQI
jgi:hypothetical protein